jgi:copper(I)-binding protein
MNTAFTTKTKTKTLPTLLLLAVTTLFAATGCAASSESATPTASASAADSITIEDAWVKAADDGMSAAFGTLENSGDTDITVVSAESPASTMIELHETVENDAGEMVMQAKKGGFVIPAGGSLELAPGANHIMLMGLTAPLVAGDDATFTLTLSDGSSYEFTAPAKDYTGANETYEGDMDMDSDTAN